MEKVIQNIQDLLSSCAETVGRSFMCISQKIKPSSKNSKSKKTRKSK